jgi:hypothetical protein
LGANKKSKVKPLISKYKFFEMFKSLHDTEVSYKDAKLINKDYNKALTQFLHVYSDWIRTDAEKHYNFKLDNQ